MAVVIPTVVTSTSASGAQVIDGSLRFEGGYLTRTPSTNGNRTTWTYSSWVKFDENKSQAEPLFVAGDGSSDFTQIYTYKSLESDIALAAKTSSSDKVEITSKNLLRDIGWYHIVAVFDSTGSGYQTDTKLYVNGVEITRNTNTYAGGQSYEGWVNSTDEPHYIGHLWNGNDFKGYMSQVYLIDGEALEATDFGYTDPLTNTWRPKKYTGDYNVSAGGDEIVSGATLLTWDDSPIGSIYSLSNSDKTATAGGGGSGYANADVWSIAIPANTTYAWTLDITNGDSTGGWYFTDSQTASGTHADERGGNSCGLRGGETSMGTHGTFATANGTSSGQSQITVNSDVSPNGTKKIDFVVYRPSSGTGKVWIRGYGSSSWIGNGDPTNTSSTASFAIPDGTTYFGMTAYDRSSNQVFTFDTLGTAPTGINSFYLPMDGNSPIGKDQSGQGNDWTPLNFGGFNVIPKATGALPILNTVNGGRVATAGIRTDTSSSSLVLALPLVGDANDVSNQINSGSTAKTTTVTNAVGITTISNFYNNSYHFDGSGDYIVVTNNSELVFDQGTFTIECWIYADTYNSVTYPTVISKYDNGDASWILRLKSDGDIIWYAGQVGGGTNNESTTQPISLGRWIHLAVVREGTGSNQTKVYVDGVLQLTCTDSSDYDDTNNIYIGRQDSSNANEFDGCIQDIRIYKGATKYTSDFIPASTNPDIFPDTPSGVALSSNLTKVYDGAVKFDGDGDYLSVSTSSDFAFGTGAYTLEFWVNSGRESGENGLFSTMTSSDYGIGIWHNGAGLYFEERKDSYDGGNPRIHYTTFAWNEWNHLAMSRDSTSGTLRAFVNGVQVGTVTSNLRDIAATSDTVIGENAAAANKALAHISNLRVLKGTALYTANFTPPTAPLTNITNTKLLCCQSNTQPGAAVVAPLVSGINNGTQWSALTTADAAWTRGPLLAFNGGYVNNDGNTTAHPTGINKTITCDFTGQGLSGNVKIFGYTVSSGTAYQQVKFDDGSWINLTGTSTGYYWFDAGDQGSFDIIYTKGINNGGAYLGGVEVAGTVLRDPFTLNGDVAATTFNPFTDDIDTVMGQETGYATLNPLMTNGSLTDGNLTHPGSSEGSSASSIKVSSGKWYAEVMLDTGGHLAFGWTYADSAATSWIGATAPYYIAYNSGTTLQLLPGGSSTLTSGTGTIERLIPWQMCLDLDNNKAYLGDGISWYNDDWNQTGSPGNPLTGENPTFTLPSGKEWYFFIYANASGASTIWANFGQKPLKYAPPEGYKLLNYANLPSTEVVRPDQYVGVATYTGTGSAHDINVGFDPDVVWIKRRNGANYHHLFNTVIGKDDVLFPNGNEILDPFGDFDSFNSKGFTISGTYNGANASGQTYVSWCWKAGGSKNTFNVDDVGYASAAAAGLTGGDITPAAASVGTKQGFSILKYAGSTGDTTIPHGLTKAPNFYIIKCLDVGAESWRVYHSSVGAEYGFSLNDDAGKDDNSVFFNDTEPTSTLFSVGSNYDGVNASGRNYMAFLWHDVPGLQKFGIYTANNSADGPYIELGFRPAIVIIKRSGDSASDTGHWLMYDIERNHYNITNNKLAADLYQAANTAETGAGDLNGIDLLSNGFKCRSNTGSSNSSLTYIYMAWAEQPMNNMYGAQSNAR